MTSTAQLLALHLAGAVSLGAWTALAWIAAHPAPGIVGQVLAVIAVAWGALAWIWNRVEAVHSRRWTWVILAWAALFRVCGLVSEPVLEDDHFRFLWDGRQLIETGNPYAAPPSAFFPATELPPKWSTILDQVNHPQVPTLYGPVCQFAFGASYLLAPGQLWPWKLILLAAEALLIGLIWHAGGDRAGWFAAWCPLAVFESSFNAHPDLLAVGLMVAGLVAAQNRPDSGRFPWGAVLLGLAVATKVFALVLVPFALVHRPRREVWAWGLTVALAYAPFWIQGSWADLAGLRAFAGEWEFNSAGYALAKLLVAAGTARVVCAAVFLFVWLILLWRWWRRGFHPDRWPPGDLVFGALLFCSATINPWYLLWLLPFVARRRSRTGTVALAAVGLSYLTGLNLGLEQLGSFDHPLWVRPLEFGMIAGAALFDWWRPSASAARR